jgi:hypothetical protein
MAGWRSPIIVAITLILSFVAFHPLRANAEPCHGAFATDCGVKTDPQQGDFRGMIAITGMPAVFETTSHAGTKAGCGDCEWTLIAACPSNDPSNPGHATLCQGAVNAPTCRRGVLERLYLSDADTEYRLVDTLCLQKTNRVIPVGNIAFGDVLRYLRDVTPPNLVITTQPRQATLAGLPTRFRAAPPARLRPTPFGSGEVTETITIAPIRSNWRWGDGDATGWVATAPTQTHRYLAGGVEHGGLTTQWGATYTITFEGVTLGPYDATGRLSRQQGFRLPVHISTPHLTSQ